MTNLKTFFLNSPISSTYIGNIYAKVACFVESTCVIDTDIESTDIKDTDIESTYIKGGCTGIIGDINIKNVYTEVVCIWGIVNNIVKYLGI